MHGIAPYNYMLDCIKGACNAPLLFVAAVDHLLDDVGAGF
jgi:hypothetical protein